MDTCHRHVPVAQWIERQIADLEVGGSNPPRHTKLTQALVIDFETSFDSELRTVELQTRRASRDLKVGACLSVDRVRVLPCAPVYI